MSPLDLLDLALEFKLLRWIVAGLLIVLALLFPDTLRSVFFWVVELETAQITQRLTEWLEGIRVSAP